MSVRKQHSDEATLYFVTFTCYEWLPLFQITNGYDLVYKWFRYLKETKNTQVTAYVIMPNHLHLILFFPSPHFSLNTIISNAKRFTAYEMIKRLEQQQHTDILKHLQSAVSEKEEKGSCIRFLKKVLMPKRYTMKHSFY